MPPFRSAPSSSQPPKDYVPGLGRGASGFTTRSDVGPAATDGQSGTGSRAAAFGDAPAGYVAGRGRGAGAMGAAAAGQDGLGPAEDPLEAAAAEGQYDHEDDEADKIWEAIDARMQSRRAKRKRDNDDTEQQDDDDTATSNNKVKIRAQFRELKDQLGLVTEDEWANIPEVGDHSLKYKQNRKQDIFTPLSDSLLEQRTLQNQDATASTSRRGAATTTVATDTDGYKSVVTNMSGLSAARGAVLGMGLDRAAADATSTSTANLDRSGYLTSLSSRIPTLAAEVGDISKARLLLKSVRDTNPKHGPGWIAAARVEEAAHKPLQARTIIQQGCEACPTSEDVWLEAARLHPPDTAKRILATAARKLPTSVAIFLKAADLETNVPSKQAVLRKALEANPTSVTLWKAAIDLEDDTEHARVLLAVAVEKVPHAVELWLALARLETYDNAQKVLNQARKTLKADRSIWMAAAQLEESQNKPAALISKIVQRAVTSLNKHDAVISRAQWLEEAEAAERSQAPLTSAAIVQHTIGKDVDEQDRLRTWTEDAKGCVARNAIATARAILAHALDAFAHKRALWMQTIQLERHHGTAESLDNVLAKACERLPHMELFWLLRAKERWMQGQVEEARQVLTDAFQANPDSETVWLAAAKLEWENGEAERARVLLQRARERAPTPRAYMKSALLEWEEEQWTAALELMDTGIGKYPTFAKLYMMGGQVCFEHLKDLERARTYYQKGLEHCEGSTVLWILASRLEETATATKARSLLELARLKNPKSPDLWLEAVRLERRAGNAKLAETLMAKALQECPASGILLAEQIRQAPRTEKKSKSANAIKRCPEDPHVIVAVAELFAMERKTDKARKWFDRAVLLNPDLGDSWVRYFVFLDGNGEEQKQLQDKCTAAEPKHGEIWTRISKAMEHRHKTVGEHLELAAKLLRSTES